VTTSDESAIAALVFAYAELLDEGRFEELAELLGDASLRSDAPAADEAGHDDRSDAHGDEVPVLAGRERILQFYRSAVIVYDDGTPGTQHVTTNLRVDVADDGISASANSYFTVLQAVDSLQLQPIVAGRYRDRFEKRASTWRFVERRFSTRLVGDLSRHLRGHVGLGRR
jgi:3-phenylpropionate/cinnamic acid dioxygenase small subunit